MTQKTNFVSIFRADGNSKIGIGHIMRCIGLAQKLLDENVKSIFITKSNEKIVERIKNFGFSVITLPNNIDLLADVTRIKEIAQENNAKLIFADIWHKESMQNPDYYVEFISLLKDQICVLVIIDGPSDKYLDCDLFIVPYVGVEKHNFQSKKLLLGSRYFIFRKEFINASKEEKIINQDIKKILVSMGGSDPNNHSIPVLRAILKYNKPNIKTFVVIGPTFNSELVKDLENIREINKKNITLIKNCDNLANFILDSDILITSDGLTKYESSIIGTPMIILTQMNHQYELKAGFYEYKSALFIDINSEDIEKELLYKLKQIVEDPSLRRLLSQRGKEFIDSKGIDRIYSEIMVIRDEKNC